MRDMDVLTMKNPKNLQVTLLPKLRSGVYHSYWVLRNTIELGNDHSYNVVANLEAMIGELQEAVKITKKIEKDLTSKVTKRSR